MSVITITGQIGAGRAALGNTVAEKMNYRIIDRQLFDAVLNEYGIVRIKELFDTPPHLLDGHSAERRDAIDILKKAYLILAKKNNIVMVSKYACSVLNSFMNVLNVFLWAPLDFRIKYIRKSRGIGDKEAETLIDADDETRIKFHEVFTDRRFSSRELFTLSLNTQQLGLDLSAELILKAAERVSEFDDQSGWLDGHPTVETIEVDPILEDAVNKFLSE